MFLGFGCNRRLEPEWIRSGWFDVGKGGSYFKGLVILVMEPVGTVSGLFSDCRQPDEIDSACVITLDKSPHACGCRF